MAHAHAHDLDDAADRDDDIRSVRDALRTHALARSHGLTLYRVSHYWRRDGFEGDTSVSLGHVEVVDDLESADYATHEYLSGSDYNGGVLVASNRDAIRALVDEGSALDHKLFVELHGGYGTEILAIRLGSAIDVWDDEDEVDTVGTVLDAMEGLDDYPCVDEDAYSAAEWEARCEAWESWARDEWERALCATVAEAFGPGLDKDDVEVVASADIVRDIFERTDPEWIDEDSGVWVNVDRAAEGLDGIELVARGICRVDVEAVCACVVEAVAARADVEDAERIGAPAFSARERADAADSVLRDIATAHEAVEAVRLADAERARADARAADERKRAEARRRIAQDIRAFLRAERDEHGRSPADARCNARERIVSRMAEDDVFRYTSDRGRASASYGRSLARWHARRTEGGRS
jgi:hypothetical protein